MWIWGGAVWGVDTWGGAFEQVRPLDSTNLGGTVAAFIRYDQDSKLLKFPIREDVTFIERLRYQDAAINISLSGNRKQLNFGRYDRIKFESLDIATDTFFQALESWWAKAKEGQEFSLGFEDSDQVQLAILNAATRGATRLDLMTTAGIVQGRRYLVRADTMGMNATRNLSANGGFNTSISGATALGAATLSLDTAFKSEGAGSIKAVCPGSGAGEGWEETLAIPARLGFITLGFKIAANPVVAMRMRIKWVENGTTITKEITFTPTNAAAFEFHYMTVIVPPKGITSLKMALFTDAATATTFWIDEWQPEQRPNPSPFTPIIGLVYSAVTEDAEEYVTVKDIYPGVAVILADPLQFDYQPRDIFKSRRYWYRLSMINADPIFTTKILTFDLKGEAREVPQL